jgi:predicted dienelactone hydrolase
MHLGDSFGHDQRAGTRGMFSARARSVSALVDRLTDAPRWRGRWPEDRIAVLGYSAGGATALALIGARASMKAVVAHCAATPGEGLCRRGAGKRGSEELRRVPDLSDPRIGAAVLFAPVTAPFTDRALARLDRPVLAVRAGLDTELLYPQHAARLATAAPRRVRLRTLHGAGHFAFLTLPQAAPLPPGMGEAKGFDRAAAHRWLESRVERFLDAAFGAGTAERRPSQPDG